MTTSHPTRIQHQTTSEMKNINRHNIPQHHLQRKDKGRTKVTTSTATKTTPTPLDLVAQPSQEKMATLKQRKKKTATTHWASPLSALLLCLQKGHFSYTVSTQIFRLISLSLHLPMLTYISLFIPASEPGSEEELVNEEIFNSNDKGKKKKTQTAQGEIET